MRALFDTLIKNARVIDGSGNGAFPADVAIQDGVIAAVGKLGDASAFETVDARGRFLTPGFIDIHRHADAAVFRDGFGKAELSQGLTTIISGNCGLSLAPIGGAHAEETVRYLTPITGGIPPELRFDSLKAYFDAAQQRPLPVNTGMLVGMGTLRTFVAGFAAGDLDFFQERALYYHLEAALADGALGVSLGLGYAPEIFYSTDGLIRALAPLYESGVPLCVHMRQEGDGVVDALREMLEVAKALKTPLQISHLKAIGTRNWRKAVPEMLSLIERARDDGVDVMCDVYPYTAGSTQLIHVLPPEFQEGGTQQLLRALCDNSKCAEMRERMETGRDFENITDLVGFENVIATGLHRAENRPFEGKSIAEIARLRQSDPYDALFDLLASEEGTPTMIDFITHDDDIRDILTKPYSGVISDATYPTAGQCHPRVYGTFARLIEQYVVKEKCLTLEQAVHKVTMQPAERFGLPYKGRIAVDADADLLLFDPANIHERGTYQTPDIPAEGFDYVFVNGEAAVAEGKLTGVRNGGILRPDIESEIY